MKPYASNALNEAEWVVYQTTKKDALRWDSKGVMSIGGGNVLLIFPKAFTVPEDPGRELVWQGQAKTSTDGLGIASRYAKRGEGLKEAVATMRALLDDVESDIEAARKQLASLVKKYKKLERTDPDKPPANGMPWSPRDGRMRVVENQAVKSRVVRLGVAIGSKFAQEGEWTSDSTLARLKVVAKIEAEVKAILQGLVKTHGGFIDDADGSAYSVLGWVQK